MKVRKSLIGAACGVGVATLAIGVTVANADPVVPAGGNAYDRPLHGEGSDTTDLVMNGMAEAVTIGGNKVLASWDAKSSTGFVTRNPASNPNCSYQGNPSPDPAAYVEGFRANGSSNGQRALRDAFTAGKTTLGCLDFARSSSLPTAGNLGTVGVYAVPLATDGQGYVRTAASALPKTLTKAQLQGAYHCAFGNWKQNTNPAGPTNFKALIPQAGSGTRKDWLTLVGLTEADIAANTYKCVTDQTDYSTAGGPNPIQEHDSRAVNNFAIAPVGIAQYIAQRGGASTDFQGSTVLGTIKNSAGDIFSYPIALNPSYGDVGAAADNLAATRTVYNVLPRSTVDGQPNTAPQIQAFIDTDADPAVNTSLICQQLNVIKRFGFTPIGTCGSKISVN